MEKSTIFHPITGTIAQYRVLLERERSASPQARSPRIIRRIQGVDSGNFADGDECSVAMQNICVGNRGGDEFGATMV